MRSFQRSELCWLQLESLRSPNFGNKGDWEPKKVEYPLSAKFLHTLECDGSPSRKKELVINPIRARLESVATLPGDW